MRDPAPESTREPVSTITLRARERDAIAVIRDARPEIGSMSAAIRYALRVTADELRAEQGKPKP